MSENQRVSVIVHGRVHAVAFRAGTVREASGMGLSGVVRNLSDGTVEIIAEGPIENLERLIQWSHHGPPAAIVERVDVSMGTATGEFDGFEVRF